MSLLQENYPKERGHYRQLKFSDEITAQSKIKSQLVFGSVILNKPETNIAQLAMVIMRMNEIEFMSIITIQVGQCLLPVCSTEDKI